MPLIQWIRQAGLSPRQLELGAAAAAAQADLQLSGNHVLRRFDATALAAQADLQLVGNHVRRHLAAVTVVAQGAFALVGNHLLARLAVSVIAGQATVAATSTHAFPKRMPFAALASSSFLKAPAPRRPRLRHRFKTTRRP